MRGVLSLYPFGIKESPNGTSLAMYPLVHFALQAGVLPPVASCTEAWTLVASWGCMVVAYLPANLLTLPARRLINTDARGTAAM